MKIKHLFVSILLATGFQPMIAQSALRQQFVNSSVQEARPWTFWYWMFGAVTPEGITADLEAMHRVGLGGAYLMPIKGVEQGPQYEGKAQQLTPEWWRMVTHSMKEADRLGMQLGMHICDGFALAGGPWMTPEESMQKVVWSDTIVNGGNIRNLTLPMPEALDGYYEDIVTYAIPLERQPEDTSLKPKVTFGNLKQAVIKDESKAVNRDEKGVFRSSYPCFRSTEQVGLRYISQLEKGSLADMLAANRERDRILGYTSTGIHKDELEMTLNGHLIRRVGSQGQNKTYLIALKLAQYVFLSCRGQARPILLLDDIFDKLDADRVEQIVKLVSGDQFGQIFITDTNRKYLDAILQSINHGYALFRVEQGEVQPMEEAE